MSAIPQSLHGDTPYHLSQVQPQSLYLNTSPERNPQQVEQPFRYSLHEKHIPRFTHTLQTSKESIARKLQRIDILLNLVYSRVANDRSLKALLPYIPENDARNLVSNFAYVRHQQDTQELKAEMTDKQTYRIFRHHYRAEQRLSDTIRELRHSTLRANSLQLSETSPESKPVENSPPLSHAVADLENDTAKIRVWHLQEVENELNQMSDMYQDDDDLLYIQEFSQAQQIDTMQARCVAMKNEYEADDMRKGRCSWDVRVSKKVLKENITGPEDWEEDHPQFGEADPTLPPLGVLNGEWAPLDRPRSPCPKAYQSEKAGATGAEHEGSVYDAHIPEPSPQGNLSPVYSKDYRERRSRRQPGSSRPEYRYERRARRTSRNQNRQKTTQLSGRSEREDRKGYSSRKPFTATNPKRKTSSKLEDYDFGQQRYSSYRPLLPSHNQGRRQHLESRTPQITSKRPGRSQRTSHNRVTLNNEPPLPANEATGKNRYHYSNAEFATMPDLRRTSHGGHEKTSYDDFYVPPQGGSGQSHYVEGYTMDRFGKPFPHESADAFGWKLPEKTMASQYDPALTTLEQPPARYPQTEYPHFPPNPPPPSLPQNGLKSQNDQMPVTTKTRKRDEWRYNDGVGVAVARLGNRDGLGVMQNIASRVKGRKSKPAVPQNPIEVMQMARKDPVKLMTTMVAGEIMPQAKRKAHKFEAMLGSDLKPDGVAGQVGKALTKVTKESFAPGASSKTGVPGQVGKTLAKMTLDSAVGGGSSKAKVGKVLANVAKDSVKQAGGSSSGTKMIKQVMESIADT